MLKNKLAKIEHDCLFLMKIKKKLMISRGVFCKKTLICYLFSYVNKIFAK